MLVAIVCRETGDAVAGVVASGLFMVTFAVSGAWLDIGRVDSFALCLLLVALYVARQVEGARGGASFSAASYSWPSWPNRAIWWQLHPVLIFLLFVRRRAGIVAFLTVSALIVGSTWALDARSHGWYGYYVFTELIHQGVVSSVWRTFFIAGPLACSLGDRFRPSSGSRSMSVIIPTTRRLSGVDVLAGCHLRSRFSRPSYLDCTPVEGRTF